MDREVFSEMINRNSVTINLSKEEKILWENTENAVTVSFADCSRSSDCVQNVMIKTVQTDIVEMTVVRKRKASRSK
jgi:hypothetical protein